jgi:WhiB family redox-sensing transcriptional regulator
MTVLSSKGEWWSLAACRSADPDLFFPISASGPARRQAAAAKAVCAGCAVQKQCLSYALAASPVHGVWGGTTEEERRLLSQRTRATAATGDTGVTGAHFPPVQTIATDFV